jgi:hypothetical protein
MQIDHSIKIVLWIIAGLLFLNLVNGFVASKDASVQAAGEAGNAGRYQISAWAAQSAPTSNSFGYYIIDTTTGQVTDSKMQVQGRAE